METKDNINMETEAVNARRRSRKNNRLIQKLMEIQTRLKVSEQTSVGQPLAVGDIINQIKPFLEKLGCTLYFSEVIEKDQIPHTICVFADTESDESITVTGYSPASVLKGLFLINGLEVKPGYTGTGFTGNSCLEGTKEGQKSETGYEHRVSNW